MAGKIIILPNITSRKVDRGTVVLDLETSEYFSLNETASRIWEMIEKSEDESLMAKELSREYGITVEKAKADIEEFIEGLIELKIARRGPGEKKRQ